LKKARHALAERAIRMRGGWLSVKSAETSDVLTLKTTNMNVLGKMTSISPKFLKIRKILKNKKNSSFFCLQMGFLLLEFVCTESKL
jgi:hypothetical protein